MKVLAGLVVVAALASTARADGQCSVEFVSSPDYVRESIEAYLEREPHCGRAIQLRIVPTDDGQLYLMAVRPDGRVHERVVPSASAAAVLVASWVADDWWLAPRETSEPPRVSVGPANAVTTSFERQPRGDASRSIQLAWLSALGSGRESISGARVEVDVLGRGNDGWHLGIAGALTHAHARHSMPTSSGPGGGIDYLVDDLESDDWRLMGTVSYRNTIGGRIELGASLGYGVVFLADTWQESFMQDGPPFVLGNAHGEDTIRAFEVGLTAGVRVTRSLAVSLGYYATPFQHELVGSTATIERGGDASFALSARLGL